MVNTTTFSAESLTDLLQRVRQSVAEGLRPTLGILFCSVALDIEATTAALAEFLFPSFACSSSGEMIVDAQRGTAQRVWNVPGIGFFTTVKLAATWPATATSTTKPVPWPSYG